MEMRLLPQAARPKTEKKSAEDKQSRDQFSSQQRSPPAPSFFASSVRGAEVHLADVRLSSCSLREKGYPALIAIAFQCMTLICDDLTALSPEHLRLCVQPSAKVQKVDKGHGWPLQGKLWLYTWVRVCKGFTRVTYIIYF